MDVISVEMFQWGLNKKPSKDANKNPSAESVHFVRIRH